MSRSRRRRAHLGLTLTLGVAAALAAPDVGAAPYLQTMMKRIDAAASAGNTATVAQLMKYVKGMGPTSLTEWGAIAERARAAAAAGDVAAMKRACNDCHEKYRAHYRSRFGSEAPDNDKYPKRD